jgi:ATP-dependent Clp protease ATP-binding subunit ClpX
MYDLPSAKNVEKVVVDESSVVEGTKPLLIYSEQEDSAA